MIFLFLILSFLGIHNPPSDELLCISTSKPLKIDGKLDEKEWSSATSITIDDRRKRSGNTALIRTLWDMQNLYISFQVSDSNLQAKQTALDHPELYLDDMVEFLIDTKNDKDSCWDTNDLIYHINLLGQKKDDRGSANCITDPSWNGIAKYAIQMEGTLNDSSDIDTGYIIEISIPWKELESVPEPGFKMGIDFAVGDTGKLFDWAGARPFRAPYAFGNLVLAKGKD